MADNELGKGKLDPKDNHGSSPEVSAKNVRVGVYVIQAKDDEDVPVGEKKFVASNDPTHVEAFLRNGYRHASEAEEIAYNKKLDDAKKEQADSIKKHDEENA